MSVEYYNIFEIKEYGSCYELVKIVDSGYNSKIAHIWFDPKFGDMGMLTKEEAFEIIQSIKRRLEEMGK